MADAAVVEGEVHVDRQQDAAVIVKSYIGWSAGASIIPLPWVDLGAVSLIQVKMVADLAKLYEVPFSKNVVKTIIGSLVGTAAPYTGARYASSYIKTVPVVGSVLGMLTAPVFTSASTYAVGKVFIAHFESGGTVLDFNVDAMRGYFKKQFGKKAAEESSEDASKESTGAASKKS